MPCCAAIPLWPASYGTSGRHHRRIYRAAWLPQSKAKLEQTVSAERWCNTHPSLISMCFINLDFSMSELISKKSCVLSSFLFLPKAFLFNSFWCKISDQTQTMFLAIDNFEARVQFVALTVVNVGKYLI